ncbi:MAG TPA: hypothetical protein VFU05_01860 [Cyclobacteriaceae bacterium]|nr:hypothetical protein [Cyclobacteriaceae bacterium]
MKILTLFFCLSLTTLANAQFQSYEIGLGYTFTAPIATMKQNINHGNGVTMDFYLTPEKISRFAFGMDINYTVYGYDKSKQEYTFDDGSTARMDIIVDNSFFNLMFGGRYLLTASQETNLKPYVSLKGGYSWFRTNLNIYDPDDNDHCEPIENDLLMKDGTFLFSAGGGIQWDLRKKKSPNRFLFNAGVNLTLGGQVSYMNTDAPSSNHMNHNSSDVNAQFINTQTQVVHEHHVGYVYTSFLEMMDFRAGFIFRR